MRDPGKYTMETENKLGQVAFAYRNIPEPAANLTDQVMRKLAAEPAAAGGRAKPVRWSLKPVWRVALLTGLSTIVVAGGAYAYVASGFLAPLKDKSGQESMAVAYTNIPAPPQAENDISEKIKQTLSLGEQANIYFGEQVLQPEADKDPRRSTTSVMGTRPFDSLAAAASYLASKGVDITLPQEHIDDWMFTSAQVSNKHVFLQQKPDNSEWIYGTDETTGLKYKYFTFQGSSEPDFLMLYYKKGQDVIRLSVSISQGDKPVFYDANPSEDSVLNIEGVGAYLYKEPGRSEIVWSERVGDGGYRVFHLTSAGQLGDQELKAAAVSFIKSL